MGEDGRMDALFHRAGSRALKVMMGRPAAGLHQTGTRVPTGEIALAAARPLVDNEHTPRWLNLVARRSVIMESLSW